MKLTILTSPKTVEAVNCILGQAIESLMENGKIAKSMGLTAKDVVKAEQFRMRLLNKYFKLCQH